MFEIPVGARVYVFMPGVDPARASVGLPLRHTSTSRVLYEKHEVIFDPRGNLGRGKWRRSTDYYGFRIDAPGNGWHGGTVIANQGQIKYDGVWMIPDNQVVICRACGFAFASGWTSCSVCYPFAQSRS